MSRYRQIKISDVMNVFMILAIALVYYWTAQLGFMMAWKNTNVSPVWPPAAIGFIIIFSLGKRLWPAIWLGAFLANLSYFLSDPTLSLWQIICFSMPIATGNTLEAVIACELLNKLNITKNPLHKVQDILRFMLFTMLGCVIAATMGSLTVCISSSFFWKFYSTIWLTWLMGDFGAILTLTPLFWALGRRFAKPGLKRAIEFLVLFGVLFVINGMIFSGKNVISQNHMAITHLPLALMVWFTYRFGYLGASASIFLSLIQDIPGTHNGFGPFVTADKNTSMLLLQTFLETISGTTLLLAAALFERRQSQQEVIFSEQRFKALVENSSDMIVLLNPLGIITYSSPSTEKIMGYSKQEHEGHNILEFVHPDFEVLIMEEFAKVLRTPGETVSMETRVRHKNGDWRWIECNGRNLLFEQAVNAIVVNYRDITDRKRDQERFQQVVESAPNAMVMIDDKGAIQLVNKATEALFGYNRSELLKMKVEDLIPHRFRAEHPGYRKDFFNELKARPMGKGRDLFAMTKDKNEVPVEIGLTPIEMEGKIFVLASIINITERKRNEEAIREEQERLSSIINSSLDAMVGMDENGLIIFWNPQAEKIFGWKTEEVVGKNTMVNTIIAPQFKDAYESEFRLFGDRGAGGLLNQRVELFGLHRTGKEFPMEITISMARLKGKRIFTAFLRDISDRKMVEDILKRDKAVLEKLVEERSRALMQTQEELKHASRLADIGTLAAIMAHELRTPLGVIQMAIHNLKNKHKDLQENSHVANIEKKVWEGNRIIDNLLTYSRIKTPTYESFSILNLLEESISNISQQAKDTNVEIKRQYKVPPEFEMDMDPNQIREVFLNILNNAYQAMKDKTGIIYVTVEEPEQDNVLISIADNGGGIDPDNLDKIFRPFFTTKAKGTGLGLAICNEIVNLHHGRIEIKSTLGQGTTLDIFLPKRHKTPSEISR